MTITNPRHAQVVELYKMGIEIDQIAIQVGYARASSVSEIASKYGCIMRRPSGVYGDRDAEILRMSKSGMTGPQIAREVGLSTSAVHSIVSRERKLADDNEEASDVRVKAWSASPAAIARAVAKHCRRGVSA